MRHDLAVVVVLAALAGAARAQEANEPKSDEKTDELSLADLLDTVVSIASKRPTALRDQPGIVSVITAEQIRSSGARDLVDAVEVLVPGFSFGIDIGVSAGLIVRGIWGSEGKVLVMLDGQELNEELYGTVQFFRQFPADMIERIEIMRGPGSAVYGGYASLAVINVISKDLSAGGNYLSVMNDQAAHKTLETRLAAGAGGTFGDLAVTAHVSGSRGVYSDRSYSNYRNEAIDLGIAPTEVGVLNIGMNWADLHARLVSSRYRMPYLGYIDGFEWPWGTGRYDTHSLEMSYDLKLSSDAKVTPFVNYKRQYPYYLDQQAEWKRFITEKKQAGLTFSLDLTPKTNVLLGYQGFLSGVTAPSDPIDIDDSFIVHKGQSHFGYRNQALFAQLMAFTELVNVTLGARFDDADTYGSNFAPRVGLTKVFDQFHWKYMVAQSFRSPSLFNQDWDYTGEIRPERAINHELEVGYEFSSHAFVTVNAFDIRFRDIIVYSNDVAPDGTTGFYTNEGHLNSRGVEAELKYIDTSTELHLNIADAVIAENDVGLYKVPDQPHAALGAPQEKVGLMAGYRFTRSLGVYPSVMWLSKRYAYTTRGDPISVDPDTGAPTYGDPNFATLPAVTLAHINLRARDVLGSKSELSLGVHNLTDTDYVYPQPYLGYFAPIPQRSRSFTAEMTLGF